MRQAKAGTKALKGAEGSDGHKCAHAYDGVSITQTHKNLYL